MELRDSRLMRAGVPDLHVKKAPRLLHERFYLSSSYIPGMPEIFSSTGGEAPKIIPTMTIVEAEEHDSDFFFRKIKSKQIRK